MDAYSSIMSRRSVRAFKAEMPPMDLVMKVVDAGALCSKRDEHAEMAFHGCREQREN